MERRVLLFVVLCVAILFVWNKLFPGPQGGMPSASVSTPNTISSPAGASAGPAGPSPSAPAQPAAQLPGQPAAQPQPQQIPEEQIITVERPGLYRAKVTSYGAALSSFELLNHKYYSRDLRRLVLPKGASQPEVERRQMDGPTDLITTYMPSLEVHFPQSGFSLPPVQAWSLVANEPQKDGGAKLVYRWSSPEVQLQKTLVFSGTSYTVAMNLEVKNLKSTPLSHHLDVGLEGFQDPTQKSGGMFSARVPQNEVVWDLSGKMQSLNLEALQERISPDKLRGDLRWIGIGQQYFILAAALPSGPQVGDKQGHAGAQANGAMSVSAEYSEKTLGPGETAVYPVTLYAGPKVPELLDEVTVNGASGGLKTSINYTLEVLARPLLWVLRQLHALGQSWALAIVLLTLLVKLVTLYPSHKSMRSMKAMAELKPQIEALKEKCGDDKQRFNTEMMALYKRHGVNPLGGCLPMLLQMPIYFALYSMLGNAVELYRVPFLWIPDLTAADPFFVLPLVTGGLMYVQTKLSPAPPDPQQKMMTVMMPFMFTLFTVFVPAGLTLYILTNTVLGMIQQAVINRGQKKPAVASK